MTKDSPLRHPYKKMKNSVYLTDKLIFAMDMGIAALCFFIAVSVRFMLFQESDAFEFFFIKLLAFLTVTGCFFYIFNTYSENMRQSMFLNMARITLALLCSHVFVLLLFITFPDFFPYSPYNKVAAIISFLLTTGVILIFRMIVRINFDYSLKRE